MAEKLKDKMQDASKKLSAPKKGRPFSPAKWWRETIGELRKVSWPTTHEAWRLTKIVIVVMVIMSFLLGFFDFVFSKLIGILYA
jgi:preprotein translocase subunit SecE